MTSPLSSRFHRRLKHGFPEHVAGLLHRSLTHSVQRRTKPRAGRHFRRARLVKSEVEAPVSRTNGKRRPVGPFVHQHPLNGLVSMAFVGMARTRMMTRCPAAGLLANALGRYAGSSSDGGPLRVAAHGLKSSQHHLMALHLETDFHGP